MQAAKNVVFCVWLGIVAAAAACPLSPDQRRSGWAKWGIKSGEKGKLGGVSEEQERSKGRKQVAGCKRLSPFPDVADLYA